MKTVLFILKNRTQEQVHIYSVPLDKYVPIAQHAYLEEGCSIPIPGHAVAFDTKWLRGIFSITTVYPGSGRIILPELGNKKTLGTFDSTVSGYRACIVPEPSLEKVPWEAIPVMCPSVVQ